MEVGVSTKQSLNKGRKVSKSHSLYIIRCVLTLLARGSAALSQAECTNTYILVSFDAEAR